MKAIYAIIDIPANEIVGQLLMARHDTVAVRTFTDIITAKEPNLINTHPADFDLVRLCEIDDDEPTRVIPNYEIITNGQTIKAALTQEN